MASLTLPRSLALPWRRPAFQFLVPRPASLSFIPPPARCRYSFFSSDSDKKEEEEEQLDRWPEPVALVTGASRGLGLEFTRQLLTKYPGTVVWGTARNPETSQGLQALKRRHPVRLEVGTLDVTKEETVEELAGDIEAKYGRLDLIVNCAGILHIPDVLQPEATISKVEAKGLMLAFEVNAIGPAIVSKHMWELLKIGQGHGTGRAAAVIANISAKCSSMKDNTLAGWYGYRASKTALNQITKNMAVEAIRKKDPIICVLLHPGTVNTNLSKPYSANVPHMKLFSTDYAVERLLGIINKVRPEDNGKFTSWDRQEVPF